MQNTRKRVSSLKQSRILLGQQTNTSVRATAYTTRAYIKMQLASLAKKLVHKTKKVKKLTDKELDECSADI